MTNSEWVTLHILYKAVSSHLMTNRKWLTLHILWNTVSSHVFLWPTASGQHCTFCERQSHHIFCHDQQFVSHIAPFVKASLITCFFSFDQQQAVSDIINFLTCIRLSIQWLTYHLTILCHGIYVYQKVRMLPYVFHIFLIIIIDCKISFQLTHSHFVWSSLSLISLSLISRWVILVHGVLIFMSVCMLVCRSDNTLDVLLLRALSHD